MKSPDTPTKQRRAKTTSARVKPATKVASLLALQSSVDFRGLYTAPPTERINLIRKGVPATYLLDLSKFMGVTKDNLFTTLQLPRATIDRKLTNNQVLPSEQGERVIGMAKLVGQVQTMVEQSGNPEGFDAGKWVAHWLAEPSPALGGERPAAYMDTVEGQELVSNLIARMQSGAYA